MVHALLLFELNVDSEMRTMTNDLVVLDAVVIVDHVLDHERSNIDLLLHVEEKLSRRRTLSYVKAIHT